MTSMRRAVASAWIACALGSVAGCATALVAPPADHAGVYTPLTTPITIVGDTQEHEATGFPLHSNSGAIDSYVEVAQRPPEQPLFGRRVLEAAIGAHPAEPLIHLGDLLDMSCASELDRMYSILRKATQPVVFVPGNHDGLLFGIFNYDLVSESREEGALEWVRGCRAGAGSHGDEPGDALGRGTDARGRGPGVNKGQLITSYLTTLALGPFRQEGLVWPPTSDDFRVSWHHPHPWGVIRRIEARLVKGVGYAKTFIVQKLRLPRAPGAPHQVVIVAVDTTQIEMAIGVLATLTGESPGDLGRVLPDQMDAIEEIVRSSREAGEIVVFAGHHDWAKLGPLTRARLAVIMRRLNQPLVYISAHTHSGFWARHELGDDRHLLELNVSSLSDWPLAYRRVSFAMDQTTNRLKVIGELMPRNGRAPGSDDELLAAWKAVTCERSGVAADRLADRDLTLVKEQKDSRGTLVDWLLQGLGEWCTPCQESVYAEANRYQNAMLHAIAQTFEDLRGLPELASVPSPPQCEGRDIVDCINGLRGQAFDDLSLSRPLFEKKAAFVDFMGTQFDALHSPQAHAYMACRAVLGAKDDFDLTADSQRSVERTRRTLDFFRTEATIGIE